MPSAQPMDNSIILRYHSPHLDQGFPGSINTQIIYTLTFDNHVLLEFAATVADDSPEKRSTPFNLTQHTYFQLGGTDTARTVEDHTLTLPSKMWVVDIIFLILAI